MQQKNNILLVMLHGFLGSHQTFLNHKTHIENEDDRIKVLSIDLPGHGGKCEDDVTWDFEFVSRYVLEMIKSHQQNRRVVLMGYSMGGRVALYMATHYPNAIDGLIIENASPGIEDREERQKRHLLDVARGEAIVKDYKGFVKRWAQLPLFQTAKPLPESVANLQQSIRLSHDPKQLKKALVDYGTGNQPNLWPLLAQINVPVLLLSGTLDLKFTNITKRMHQLIPNCTHIECNAGHTIHVEDSRFFDTIIVSFIKEEIQ